MPTDRLAAWKKAYAVSRKFPVRENKSLIHAQII
jgi:hypothetical protein